MKKKDSEQNIEKKQSLVAILIPLLIKNKQFVNNF